jgi:hypothetical protein
MKIKQIFAFALIAVSSAFVFTSCGPGEDNLSPVIDIISEAGSITGDVTLDGDKAFTLVFNVSDDSKVKTIEVVSSVDGRSSIQLDSTVSTKTIKIKLSRKTLARIATETWTISATDDAGSSSNKSFVITTNTSATGNPLTSYTLDNNSKPFKVWNFHGPNTGAFDLLDGSPKTSGDAAADKDLHDSTSTAEIAQWPGRWCSKNGTTFKLVTSYAYADIANTGQLDAAWNAAGTEMKYMLVKKGDLYIAKLRGTNTKVLVSITDVMKTTGDNLDYVQFIFKKE